MTPEEVAADMERWADTQRGEMVRSATAEREVRRWAEQLGTSSEPFHRTTAVASRIYTMPSLPPTFRWLT